MKSLYESIMDIDNNIGNIDESIVAEWATKHEIYRETVDVKCIKKNGDKFDILPNKPIYIRVGERDNVPFKIGKLNGYLELNYIELNGDHIIDECGGLMFNSVKGGKKLKNATIKINSDYQISQRSSNCVSFWKSAGLLSAMKNITFDFTDAPNSSFDIDTLKKNSLKNIEFINCDMVLSNSEAKVTLDDIKDIKGVSKIYSNSGRTEEFSFYYDGKKWNQGRK